MTPIEKLCDELQLNIVAKRHYQREGRANPKHECWDLRITHSWFNGPILSATNFPSFEAALNRLNERISTLEHMRVGIERKNAERTKKFKEDNVPDHDQWFEMFD